jgi:polar amino acid transport system substrate-binding protein
MEDSAVLRNAVDKTGGRLMISSKVQLYPVIVGLGINPKNGDLVKVVENALESLRKDGQYQKLLTKYNVSAPTAAEFKAAVTSKAP